MQKINITALAETQGRITIRLSNGQNLLLPDQREGTQAVMRSLSNINLCQKRFDSLIVGFRELIFMGTDQGDLILKLSEPIDTAPFISQISNDTEARRLKLKKIYDLPSASDPHNIH